MTDNTEIHHGTDNVFADLNFPDPEAHLLKARFVARMTAIVRDKNLTQTQAARLMGISQPDVSRLLKGQFRDLSLERILRLLTRLGCEVEILVKSPGSTPDTIRVG
jgi:predicted XRE-type DNA-binding protein